MSNTNDTPEQQVKDMQKPPTVAELIQQTRTIPVKNYDAIANQLIQFSELSTIQGVEIIRLQDLLRKHNIQFTIPETQLETPPTTQS